jgi:hypothetical protein
MRAKLPHRVGLTAPGGGTIERARDVTEPRGRAEIGAGGHDDQAGAKLNRIARLFRVTVGAVAMRKLMELLLRAHFSPLFKPN